MKHMLWTVLGTATLILLVVTTPSRAAFPGLTGKVLFQRQSGGLTDQFVMNADGTGETRLTFGGSDWHAAWSPDGRRMRSRAPGRATSRSMR